MKVNVNPNWLPPLPLARSVRGKVEALLLNGSLGDPGDLPFLRALAPEEQSYLREKATQIGGQPARLLALTAGLETSPPEEESARTLWQERAFLRGFAFSRLGREAEADAFFLSLPVRFHAGIRAERALLRLNRGELVEAESLFVAAAKAPVALDPYTACTLLGGLSLARIQQGDFLGAEQALRERRRILRAHPSPTLAFGTQLYEVLLRLERNDFEAAAAVLERSLSEIPRASVNGFFLRHLQLRLNLARNELASAEESLHALDKLRRELEFPEGVLDFRLEEIEWNIRRGNPEGTAAAIEALEPAARHDQYLRFRLGLLRAQALAQRGKNLEAFAEIQRVIELGEAQRYRPGLSWAFLHAAGIALAAGHPLAARIFLSRGRHLSAQLHLPVRLAGFSYMADVLEERFASSTSLLSLARHQEIGPELEYFLGAYGFLNEVSLTVSSGAGREVVAEPRLRRQLFRSAGLFWFQKESVLLVNRGGPRVLSIELPPDLPLTALFRLLWSELENPGRGISLKDVHAIRSSAAFREHLHAGAAKMLVSRLRQKLSGSELALRFDRANGRYAFYSDLPCFTIQSGAAGATAGASPRNRKAEILARIAMEPFVRTQTLTDELGVSRQALHGFLKELCKEGRIRLVRRGPASGYVYKG
jgi:tetratricopeptide (TPR) repeat protein